MTEPLAPTRPPGVRPPGLSGSALFALGFRPLYLLAALSAAVLLPLWIAEYRLGLSPGRYVNGPAWHAHEIVFGYAAAVIAGFLFTAARNWTGIATPSGATLASICLVWIAGRVLMLSGPPGIAAAVDIAFLPVVAFFLSRVLIRADNRRNYFLPVLLLVLSVLNLLFHLALAGKVDVAPGAVIKAALCLVIVLVAVMGGRVIPFFTANALPRLRQYRRTWLDAAAIASIVVAFLAFASGLPGVPVAALCFLAAVLNAIRLAGWRPDAVLRRPILGILHFAYAWIPAGFLLLGLSALGRASELLAWHAFGAGALGSVIIGMITRTSRGHTGSAMVAGRADIAAYLLVGAGALIRVFGPVIAPGQYSAAVLCSGLLWSSGFFVFLCAYGPLLCRARADGKPG